MRRVATLRWDVILVAIGVVLVVIGVTSHPSTGVAEAAGLFGFVVLVGGVGAVLRRIGTRGGPPTDRGFWGGPPTGGHHGGHHGGGHG